jgi:hypothetical protein
MLSGLDPQITIGGNVATALEHLVSRSKKVSSAGF